jgi:hypothetical protein
MSGELASSNGTAYVCPYPGCERVFTRQQGLTRHVGYAHEGKRPSLPRTTPASPPALSAEALEVLGVIDSAQLAAPLHAAIARYEERLVEVEAERRTALARLDAERRAIQEAIRPVRAAVATLEKQHGKPGPKSAARDYGIASEDKIASVAAYIERYRDELSETGFSNKTLLDRARERKQLSMHDQTMRNITDELHKRGMIRVLRALPGGGKLYAPLVDAPVAEVES